MNFWEGLGATILAFAVVAAAGVVSIMAIYPLLILLAKYIHWMTSILG